MSPSATTNGAPRSHTLVPSAERASELAGALAVGDDTADVDCVPLGQWGEYLSIPARSIQKSEYAGHLLVWCL